MKNKKHLLRSARFVHAVQLAIIAGVIVVVPLAANNTAHLAQFKPKPAQHVSTSVAKPRKQAAKTPAPVAVKPTPPPAAAPPKTQAPSTPAPVAPQTAVAQAAASPGSGVSTLTPTSTSTSTGTSTSTSSSTSNSSPSGGTITTSPTTKYSSTNWAGYMSAGDTYTAVSAAWVAPTVTGNNTTDTADATWVGIGGVSSNDLIQAGTENTVDASGNVATAAFYELLPDFPIYPASITVNPGDTVSVAITETTTGTWTITITDATDNQTFTKSVTYTSTYSSAEWIQEDPSYADGSLVPLDTFGSVQFSNASTTVNKTAATISGSSSSPITLVGKANRPIATPSSLGIDGASFTVTQK